MNKKMYRQGDVLLVAMEETTLPEEAQVLPNDGDRVVLAYGEVTGHAHALSDKVATLYQAATATILEAREGAVLRHEEHTAIALPVGLYRVIRQRELTPEDEIRQVAD